MLKKMMMAMLTATLLTLAVMASADAMTVANPPIMSLERASVGVGASYYTWNKQGFQIAGLLPKAYVSYSLTPQLSLAASGERDFAHKVNFVHAGARTTVVGYHPEDKLALALGVDYVYYNADSLASYSLPQKASWSVSTRAAWVVWATESGTDRLYATASVEYDPQNYVFTYRVGMQAPLLP